MTYQYHERQIPEFSFEQCAWYVDRGFHDSLHRSNYGNIEKSIIAKGQPSIFTLSGGGNRISVQAAEGHLPEAQFYVNIWLDLERDISSFVELAKAEPDFYPVFQAFRGLRLIRIPDLFEALSWSIIGQQINLAFAYTLKRRLVENYGQAAGKGLFLFPTPDILANADPSDLLPLQFSRRKAEYLVGIARIIAEGKLSIELLEQIDKTSELEKWLMQWRGIGPWSANYVMLRCLGRTDAIPHGDAGMINAWKRIFNVSVKPHPADIKKYLDRFPRWQSYVVLYWWRFLSANQAL